MNLTTLNTETASVLSIPGTAGREPIRLMVCGTHGAGKTELVRRILDAASLSRENPAARTKRSAPSTRPAAQASSRELLCRDAAGQWHVTTSHRELIIAEAGENETAVMQLAVHASRPDAALLVIDAAAGMTTAVRRKLLVLARMQVPQLVIALNKIDEIRYSADRLQKLAQECTDIAGKLGQAPVAVIPVSSADGANVTFASSRTRWHTGPPLVDVLDSIAATTSPSGGFLMPVQWTRKADTAPDEIDIYGTVISGQVSVGDQVRLTSSGSLASVRSIFVAGTPADTAQAGAPVVIRSVSAAPIARGETLTSVREPVEIADQFEATILWVGKQAGMAGRMYDLRLATQQTTATITSIRHAVDADTYQPTVCKKMEAGDVTVCHLGTSQALAFETYERCRAAGSFVLTDRITGDIAGCGLIRHSLRRASNIHRQSLQISRADRERLNRQPGRVVWLTGLSGSGKSTIANALEVALHDGGCRTYILDGDNIRHGLNRDLGFNEADRVENIRRVAEVARLMLDAGLIVITAFISPFRREREMARELIGSSDFMEIFVDTPLAICERRDVKGLYRKARSGALPNFTGIDSPYEPPLEPALSINGEVEALDESVKKIMDLLTD